MKIEILKVLFQSDTRTFAKVIEDCPGSDFKVLWSKIFYDIFLNICEISIRDKESAYQSPFPLID